MTKYFSILTGISLFAFVLFSGRDNDREWKHYQQTAYQKLRNETAKELRETTDKNEQKKIHQRMQALKIASESPELKQIILPGDEEADRCIACHVELEGQADYHTLTDDGRTFEEVGCVFYHGGNGAATTKQAAHQGLGKEAIHGIMRPSYVGAKKCRECHPKEYASWTRPTAPMWQAFRRLKGTDATDPGCLACHTTGLGRGGYDPELPPDAVLREFQDPKTGKKYQILNRDFHGIWCEACHGPGSDYVNIFESGGDAREAKEKGGLNLPSPSTCVKCHTEQWSPNFSYDKYWSERCLHAVDWWRAERTW
ncbi:MAG: hypothetical protein COZ05_05905 [Armatimonadetes bacterium CG_4_10_14_3_um_filter_59_10]|nr:MAG: hypothetical protein COZ05_05905 [Armatimonadetes bacterium CG_4_10_14_3_um_filter_59_10]